MRLTATTTRNLLFTFLISLNVATAQRENRFLRRLCKREFFQRLRICQPYETASPTFASLTLAPTPAPGGRKCFEDRNELKNAVDTYIAGDPNGTIKSTYGDPIGSWCVGKVTDMSYMFQNQDSFNEDISNWNVSSVTDMRYMFANARSFNGDISNWNVSSVKDMNRMFDYATSFNQDISNWNVSSVTNMDQMFEGASAFNQNLCAWGTISDPGDDLYFVGTNCPNTTSPDFSQSPPGPFCYNCL